MKTIATFTKPEEAHLLRMRLEASGIPAFIQDENITQLGTWRASAIGGVRVQVGDNDVDAAQCILAEKGSQSAESTPPKETDAIECCSCHAPIPFGQARCAACGWSYEDKVEDANEENA